MFKKSFFMLCAVILTMTSCTTVKPVSDTDENGNYILPEKQLKLTVWNLSDAPEKKINENDVVAKWLNEKTNVTVSKVFGNNGKIWTDRLAQLVMDSQLPNIVNAENGEGMVQFLKLDKIKKVYKLTEDEIKKYAPDLWKKTPEKYWDYLKNKDGNILGIPYNLPVDEPETLKGFSSDDKEYITKYTANENDIFPQNERYLWIRDDILKDFYPEAKSWNEIVNLDGDFLGENLLDIPITSTEEYIAFMYSVANGEYTSQNNKKVYAYGYCDKNAVSNINMLGADMYGYKNHDFFTSWKDDTINLMLDDEIVHNALKSQNQMISDEVIDGDSIYDTEKEYTAKFLDGRYAIISPDMNIEEINQKLEENNASFRYRPFLTDISSEYSTYKTKNIFGGAICILNNLTPAQVHQVLNWINIRFGDEFDSVNNWGTENMYTESESGKRLFKNDALNRYFILGETDAISSPNERFGLSDGGSLLNVFPSKLGKYAPAVMYKIPGGVSGISSKFKFPPDSVHVSGMQSKPVSDILSSIYASIPEVTDFLNNKSEIESEAKRLLIKSPDEFDDAYAEFIKDVYKITDIATMEEKMTAAAQK